MAVRNLRFEGDEILRKKCRKITEITPKIATLIDDMLETMYEENGVGLAAPQVGILKRLVVIDVGEGPIVLVNPVILETSGEQTGGEGCLSVPGKTATVTRPNYVKVQAFDREMRPFELEGTQLLARAICHECDHLDGKLYVDIAEGPVLDTEAYYAKLEEMQKDNLEEMQKDDLKEMQKDDLEEMSKDDLKEMQKDDLKEMSRDDLEKIQTNNEGETKVQESL